MEKLTNQTNGTTKQHELQESLRGNAELSKKPRTVVIGAPITGALEAANKLIEFNQERGIEEETIYVKWDHEIKYAILEDQDGNKIEPPERVYIFPKIRIRRSGSNYSTANLPIEQIKKLCEDAGVKEVIEV